MSPWQRVSRIWNNVPFIIIEDGIRTIFVSDMVYTSCNFDCPRRFNCVMEAPHIIIERGSRYNVALNALPS